MLIDVEFKMPEGIYAMILGLIGAGSGPLIPERIRQGVYQCGHWSPEYCLVGGKGILRDRYRQGGISLSEAAEQGYPEYGVCDHPDQLLAKYPIIKDCPEKLFVTCVPIFRAQQPREGGWRWHKWGEYIGAQEPQCEYLHDEPVIETVYTFQVYELKA